MLERIRKEKQQLVKEGKLKKKDLEEKPISEDEIPFEIPESWEWVRLVDIGVAETGTTPSKSHPEYFGTFIPFLGPANMLNGQIISETQGLSELGANYGRIVPKGSILQVCIGGSIGKCAIVDKAVTFNQQINSITPLVCVIEFIYYVLQSDYFRLAIKDKSTGTATPIINRGNWESLTIPLPPLAEQKRIVTKIEELLPKVEEYGKAQDALNKLNEELPERLKKSVLQEAIEGRLVPQDPNDEPASALLAKIREEKKQLVKEGKLKKKDLEEKPISEDEIPFEIPESWEWVRMGDISEIARGGSPRPIKDYLTEAPNGLNWIKIGDTDKGGKYINSCKEKIKPEGLKKTRLVRPGDFLLTNSMSFGRPYITNIEGCIHDGWLMISPYASAFNQSYLYYVLSSAFAYRQFSGKVAGAVVQNLNSDKVADSYIPLPPLAEQYRIVEKIEQLFKEIDKLKI